MVMSKINITVFFLFCSFIMFLSENRSSYVLNCDIKARITRVIEISPSFSETEEEFSLESAGAIVKLEIEIIEYKTAPGHGECNYAPKERKEITIKNVKDDIAEKIQEETLINLRYSYYDSMTPDGGVSGSEWILQEIHEPSN